MLLSRNAFLSLAGEKLPRFQALQRRNQVPLWASGRDEPEVADRRGYLPFEAVLFRVADKLADHLPYDRETVARMVSANATDALALIFEHRKGKRVGVIVSCLGGYHLFAFGSDETIQIEKAANLNEPEGQVEWSTIVYLTDEIAEIVERATDLGIKLLPADE